MKSKQTSLSRLISAIGCVLAAVALAVFFLIAGDRTVDPSEEKTSQPIAPWIVRPDHFGSYGELMFAYIGENNLLYNLDDESVPLTRDAAGELLYASDDSVLYLSPCEIRTENPGREFLIRELQVGEHGNMLSTIASVSIHPCWSGNDEVIYFVRDQDPQTLCTFEPLTSTTEDAAGFDQPIRGLRISSDGLLVSLENGEELLYVPLSKSLTTPLVDCQRMSIQVCEQYDLVLSSTGELFYHWQGSPELMPVSTQVLAAVSHQDNELYYLKEEDGAVTLCAYIVSEESESILAELPESMMPQLTADASYALMLGRTGTVYQYDIAGQEVQAIAALDLQEVHAPLISLFDYRLMVYDLSREPDQTFCWAQPLEALQEPDTGAPVTELVLLSMGDHGAAVDELQHQLAAGSWLAGHAPSFFDVPTLLAVQHAQSALRQAATGVVTGAFLETLAEDAPQSGTEPYGIEIRDAQARLRTLGYLTGPVSGVWDEETEQAVAKLRGEDTYTSLMDLLASAQSPLQPLPLALGDTGEEALLLNHRLYDLRYMAVLPDATVTQATLDACSLFMSCRGEESADSTIVSGQTQQIILDESAPACPADSMPARVSATASSQAGQVITDKELKVLRKWLTKSFAVNHTDRQAVKRLQWRLMQLGYLSGTAITMVYDADTAAAVSAFQQARGITVDGIPTKRTLMELFGLNNMQLMGE